jgi:large subunit ribosomal protein L16
VPNVRRRPPPEPVRPDAVAVPVAVAATGRAVAHVVIAVAGRTRRLPVRHQPPPELLRVTARQRRTGPQWPRRHSLRLLQSKRGLEMLMPRRIRHRKQHHPKRGGVAKGGTRLAFGDFGIQAVEGHYVTNRQIESARIAMTRHIKRGGKVWINIYPDRPLTKKPAETRMGSGKGSPEWWIANVKAGRVMFELSGVPEDVAREAMRRAMYKLPMKCRFLSREAGEF